MSGAQNETDSSATNTKQTSSMGSLMPIVSAIFLISASIRLVSNTLGAVAILCRKALRQGSKAMLLVSFLFLCDAIGGLQHFCIAAFSYETNTRVKCFFTLRNITLVFGAHSSVVMLLLISADRFLAVYTPFWYFKQTTKYAWKMFLILWVLCLPVFLLSIYSLIEDPYGLVPRCLASHTLHLGYEYHSALAPLWLYGSCAIYVAVMVAYLKHRQGVINNAVAPANTSTTIWNAYKKETRVMTVTLGISTLITLFLYAIPYSLFQWLRKTNPHLQVQGWVIFIPIEWSAAANLLLHYVRQRQFRRALQALVTCKKLPERLKDWFVAPPANRNEN